MKQLYILICFLSISLSAQTAFYNAGNLGIHNNSKIGFHTSLINNADFDDTKGFVGFYGDTQISISGITPSFNEVTIDNENGVFLNTSINISGDVFFIEGDFITPIINAQNANIYVNFNKTNQNALGINNSKIDGYALATNKQNFTFPVGDTDYYRPLILASEAINTKAKCAYYSENPNTPSAFTTNFLTVRKPRIIDYISNKEFWHLESTLNSNVTLSWNVNSNLAAITDDITTIIVVGWSKSLQRWVDLGRSLSKGNIFDGAVTSKSFTPSDYEIITLGTYDNPTNVLNVDNYLVTPNGDGKNDTLIFEELTLSLNKDFQIFDLQIFDRFGLKVFEKENYSNEFNGISNTGSFVIKSNSGLPSGIYFYLINLKNINKTFQGFLYLTR